MSEAENTAALWPDPARSALGYRACRAAVRILSGMADMVVNGLAHAAPASALIPGARLH